MIVTLIKNDIWIDYDYLLKKHEAEDRLITERWLATFSLAVREVSVELQAKMAEWSMWMLELSYPRLKPV